MTAVAVDAGAWSKTTSLAMCGAAFAGEILAGLAKMVLALAGTIEIGLFKCLTAVVTLLLALAMIFLKTTFLDVLGLAALAPDLPPMRLLRNLFAAEDFPLIFYLLVNRYTYKILYTKRFFIAYNFSLERKNKITAFGENSITLKFSVKQKSMGCFVAIFWGKFVGRRAINNIALRFNKAGKLMKGKGIWNR
jgi:hypothetical protein